MIRDGRNENEISAPTEGICLQFLNSFALVAGIRLKVRMQKSYRGTISRAVVNCSAVFCSDKDVLLLFGCAKASFVFMDY